MSVENTTVSTDVSMWTNVGNSVSTGLSNGAATIGSSLSWVGNWICYLGTVGFLCKGEKPSDVPSTPEASAASASTEASAEAPFYAAYRDKVVQFATETAETVRNHRWVKPVLEHEYVVRATEQFNDKAPFAVAAVGGAFATDATIRLYRGDKNTNKVREAVKLALGAGAVAGSVVYLAADEGRKSALTISALAGGLSAAMYKAGSLPTLSIRAIAPAHVKKA